MVHVVIGGQWGDEGKGKLVDIFSQKADVIVRFHGGNNAGHTVINDYGKFPLHLVPAGIFNPTATVVIGNGTVLDLEVLLTEIAMLKKVVPDISKRLLISPRCHVIMPYHKILDRLYEAAKGKAKTGTTGRGIGPVHADKVSYQGIRLIDFFDPQILNEKLEIALKIKNPILRAFGEQPLQRAEILKTKLQEFAQVRKFVKETYPVILDALASQKYILCEGAHGFFLDTDWGTYPFVTASNCLPATVTAGVGIPAPKIKRVTAIVKAYTTRVGSGPFPTELLNATGDKLRAAGHEFGTTTGRPRRCGWLDLELIRFMAQVTGATDIAITKLDVLDTFAEIKICTGYTYRNKSVHYWNGDASWLLKVKPVYKTLPGWQMPLTDIRSLSKLPPAAQNYVAFIEKTVGLPVKMISVGPERSQTITH